MNPPPGLTSDQIEAFHRDGILVIRSFYDRAAQIEPIQRCIHRIIGLLLDKYELPAGQAEFSPETFDDGYQALIGHDRRIGGEVYDAVKQIPAFIRLLAEPRHEALLCALRDSDAPGVAAGGYGIRIDNPNEERFRANWHQDYPSQLRSIDGLVYWAPLVPVTPDLGPVEFCLASHRDGLVPVLRTDPKHGEKSGAYAVTLEHEEAVIARYAHAAPLTEPGDLVVIDFLTVHRSGCNRSNRSRWSMQMRYFNFREPTGVRMSWSGSFAAGVDLADVHPDIVVG